MRWEVFGDETPKDVAYLKLEQDRGQVDVWLVDKNGKHLIKWPIVTFGTGGKLTRYLLQTQDVPFERNSRGEIKLACEIDD